MTFALVRPTPMARMFIRLAIAMGAAGIVVALVLYAAGRMTVEDALWVGSSAMALPLAPALSEILLTRGRVVLNEDGIVMPDSSGRVVYKWEHIACARVRTLLNEGGYQRLWARLVGIDPSQQFVELQLRRRVRRSFFRTSGTDVSGIPTLGKVAQLYIAEPGRLVQEAEKHIS